MSGPWDEELDARPFINCDGCDAPNPQKRCSRCACAFYCSVACQRSHWTNKHKESCQPVEVMGRTIPSLGIAASDSTLVPRSTKCGICSTEPIEKPVILSQCQHAFCFACLDAWQRYRQVDSETETKWCPFCRQGQRKSATDEALDKAMMIAARAERSGKVDSKRKALLRASLAQLEMVLAVDEHHAVAVHVKAQILMQVDPISAVGLLERTFRHSMRSRCGDSVQSWPHIQSLPDWIFPVYLALSHAYEAAGQMKTAHQSCANLLASHVRNHPEGTWRSGKAREQFRPIMTGEASCAIAVDQYELAILAAKEIVQTNRHVPGQHRLMATAQRALARARAYAPHGSASRFAHLPTTGASGQFLVDVSTPTMQDAVRTMYRGYIYEAPWDEGNKKANKDLLMELLAEAAAHPAP